MRLTLAILEAPGTFQIFDFWTWFGVAKAHAFSCKERPLSNFASFQLDIDNLVVNP